MNNRVVNTISKYLVSFAHKFFILFSLTKFTLFRFSVTFFMTTGADTLSVIELEMMLSIMLMFKSTEDFSGVGARVD